MNFIKNIFAFIIGMVALVLFVHFIRIPILPCIYVYIITNLFENDNLKSRRFFVLIGSLIGLFIYSYNAIASIIYYPKYLNVIGIIFEFITAFSILTASIFNYSILKQAEKYNK